MISNKQIERRRNWIEELRTGGHPQVRREMTDGVGYCCLAVAEHVFGHRPKLVPGYDRTFAINGEQSQMSRETAFKLGFLATNPVLWVVPWNVDQRIRKFEKNDLEEISRSRVTLAFLNDGLGLTFKEIADVIESQPANWTGVALDGES